MHRSRGHVTIETGSIVLAANIYYGSAHNKLGVLHLARGELYEAAGPFEWAGKLMADHPGPRLNLARVLERAGRPEEAERAYRARSGHVPTLQALTHLEVRRGAAGEQTLSALREIALRGEDESSRRCARGQLARTE